MPCQSLENDTQLSSIDRAVQLQTSAEDAKTSISTPAGGAIGNGSKGLLAGAIAASSGCTVTDSSVGIAAEVTSLRACPGMGSLLNIVDSMLMPTQARFKRALGSRLLTTALRD